MLKDFGTNISVIFWLLLCGVIDYPKNFWFIGKEIICFLGGKVTGYNVSPMLCGQKNSPTKLCISFLISELPLDF